LRSVRSVVAAPASSRGAIALAVTALGLSLVACSGSGRRHAAVARTTTTVATSSATPSSTAGIGAPPRPSCAAASSSGAAPTNGPETNPPGDIPDNQAFVRYQPTSGGYSIEVPEGWARTDGPGVATFTDKFNS